MVAVRVYVEGGGASKAHQKPLRIAVKQWIEAAMPEKGGRVMVVACGDRWSAYEDFCQALRSHPDDVCLLLVDSEAKVDGRKTRWKHVGERDGDRWAAPAGTAEDNLHFMAQTMEAWLCADPDAMAGWFGQGFRGSSLPQRADLEDVPKADLYTKIAAATKPSRRGAYAKGRDLGLLGSVSPAKVIARCKHAKLFVETLRAKVP